MRAVQTMSSYQCFDCSRVIPVVDEQCENCLLCDSSNGQIISNERLDEALNSGEIFEIDPKTGGRRKNKR